LVGATEIATAVLKELLDGAPNQNSAAGPCSFIWKRTVARGRHPHSWKIVAQRPERFHMIRIHCCTYSNKRSVLIKREGGQLPAYFAGHHYDAAPNTCPSEHRHLRERKAVLQTDPL